METSVEKELSTDNEKEIINRFFNWIEGNLEDYPFDFLQELSYCDIPPEIIPPEKGYILDELFLPDNILKIGIERRLSGDKITGYRLRASDLVGVAAIGNKEKGFATLIVKPKIPGSSLFTMLSYAFLPELTSEEIAEIETEDISIVSIIILIYFFRLERLVKIHGLQRAYIKKEEELRGTVRGRCLAGDYLNRFVPAGKSQIVPCRYWELQVDSAPNRALRWGVEICRLLGDLMNFSGLSEKIEDTWNYLSPYFLNVSLNSCQAGEVRRLPRTGRFTPYESVYEILELLLDNLSLDLSGGDLKIKGFGVKMWEVFERFVINVLSSKLKMPVTKPQVKFNYQIITPSASPYNRNIYLDALIDGNHRMVLDTKWKEAITSDRDTNDSSDIIQIENLKIKNTDLFQVIAYGNHKDVRAMGAILVYPVVEDSLACKKRSIIDFYGHHGDHFPVYLIGVPVGTNIEQSINNFIEIIEKIVEDPMGIYME